MTKEIEFHAKVVKVEERFAKIFKPGFGEAKSENAAKDAVDEVSTGWWVVLQEWPVAMRFGPFKPDVEAGDTMIMTFTVMKGEK